MGITSCFTKILTKINNFRVILFATIGKKILTRFFPLTLKASITTAADTFINNMKIGTAYTRARRSLQCCPQLQSIGIE